MSAKKKRRKIVVNHNQKTGHCGPDCDKNNYKNLGAPKEVSTFLVLWKITKLSLFPEFLRVSGMEIRVRDYPKIPKGK